MLDHDGGSVPVKLRDEGDDDVGDKLPLPLGVNLSDGVGVGEFTSTHCAAAFPSTPLPVVYQLPGMGR